MTGLFESVIAELRAQKEKIDAAIEALESLGGGEPASGPERGKTNAGALMSKPKSGRTKAAKAPETPGRAVRRKSKTGLTRELVMKALAAGPRTSGAVVAALAGKVEDTAVRAMLYYLKSKGKLAQNADGAFEVAES